MMAAIVNVSRWIRKQVSELNFFEIETVRLENFDIRKAIISTRLYIILLTLILSILTLYVVFDSQNENVIIRNPSQSDYENLYLQYATKLKCPCKKIAIPYQSFVSISAEYHPICSSIFISDVWINGLFNYNISYFYPLDFRSSGSGQFQILSSLCSLAQRSVDDGIDDFLSDAYLTPVVLSSNFLDIQIESQSLFVRTSASNSFQQLLQLIRSTTFSNQLQPALQTSRALVLFIYNNNTEISMYTNLAIFSTSNESICYCGTQSTCSSSICGFFDLFAYDVAGNYTSSISLLANVTGFVVGCYAMESILQSTLECFFDSVCLNIILDFFPNFNQMNIKPLPTNETQYSSDTTINTLVNSLFIENWTTTISFTEYYNKCSPIFCEYTLMQHDHILHLIVQLLGLFGGLVIILRYSVPRLIIWWYELINNPRRIHPRIPMIERFRLIYLRIKRFNLFVSNATQNDPYELTTRIIATRVYILLTCLFVIILIIYGSTNIRTQTFTIHQPSKSTFEDLNEKYSDTLQCSCKQIAIQYDRFLSLSPLYHPICSSLFISDGWLSATSSLNWLENVFIYEDFKAVGQTFFSTLQTLCSLAQTTVFNAWFHLKQSSYITEDILPEKEMFDDINRILNEFQSNTKAEFEQGLGLIRFHSMNMFATGSDNANLATSDTLNSNKSSIDFYFQSQNWSECSCALNDQCSNPIGFYDYLQFFSPYPNSLKLNIPGLFIGCFIIESVLQSSLECFFNQTCFDGIQFEIRSNQSIEIEILQVNTTRYFPSTLIQILVNQLMLEEWGEKIIYHKYYEQCAPELCTYTLTQSRDFSYVLTLLISLFGGISIVLKVIVPFIVRWIRTRSNEDSIIDRISFICHRFKIKIKELNLFQSELSLNNEHYRRGEIQTTRIYLFLLLISLIILLIYNSTSIQTEMIIISVPNPFNSSSFLCPCENISITYHSFISIIPQFHQLCSSDFLDPNSGWIEMLYSYGIDDEHSPNDFRLFALPQFRTLSSLCILANQTLIDSFTLFASRTLINNQLQSEETIQTQAQLAVDQFRFSTSRTFVRMLDFIRDMAQGNGIVSVIQSNWYFHSLTQIPESSLWTTPRSYGDQNNCSCVTNSMCISPAIINGSLIPGFYLGCYVLDTLLQSTLECLYNVTCIDQMKSSYNYQNVLVRPLNPTLSFANETIEDLLDRLLINQWKTNISYEKYYSSCSPRFCTYSIEKHTSFIYVLTVIIGLYGGLTVALKLIASSLMKIIKYFIMHHRRRIESLSGIHPTNQ